MNEDESASEAERLAMAEEEDESEDEAPVKGKVSFQTAVDGTDDGFTVVGKGGKVVTGANSAAVAKENLFKRLVELLEERGKKSTDKLGLIDNIAKLMPIAVTPYQTLKVLLALIPARFDYVASTGFTPVDLWKNALTELNQLFDILEKHANASIGYLDEDDQEESEVLNEKVCSLYLFYMQATY